MMFIPLIIIGIIVWLLVSSGRREHIRSTFTGGERKSALEIAKERYAKGEITKEQYDQMKKDLA